MLEADLSEGDLSQVTTAIQNALRPSQPTTRIAQIAPPNAAEDKSQAALDEFNGAETGLDDPTILEPTRARSNASLKRTFPTPKVVEVNWNVEPSVDEFMKTYPPKTSIDKFLAAVAWFKEASVKDAVTPDDVYTVFRKLGWSTSIKDFSQPLRNLKGDQFLTGGAKSGFVINHLGLDKVKKFAEA